MPAKATLFVQSHVPEHAELAWILNTITKVSELERCTQFKDKAGTIGRRWHGIFDLSCIDGSRYHCCMDADVVPGSVKTSYNIWN